MVKFLLLLKEDTEQRLGDGISDLLVVVPPFHFLDNFSMTFNVLRRWFVLLHLLQNSSQDQGVPDTDGSEKVAKTTKQLMPSLARERTFQNMIGINF